MLDRKQLRRGTRVCVEHEGYIAEGRVQWTCESVMPGYQDHLNVCVRLDEPLPNSRGDFFVLTLDETDTCATSGAKLTKEK